MTQFKVGHSYYPATPILPNRTSKANVIPSQDIKGSFAQHLEQSLQEPKLKFSQHAMVRLEERGVELSSELISRLNTGMKKAQEKGSHESLLLMEGLAFVVSVKNQTVITAMDQESMENQVITNIDSAVLL